MSDHKPRVSIGLPVFNGEDYLEEALDSILAQTYLDFELIISDNASTDRTEGICRVYAAKDRRVRYYRNEENLGAAWNYNRVFELAIGDYFRWTSHDDLCAPEYLERCVDVLDSHPAVVLCYPRTVMIDEHGKRVENYFDGLNLRSPRPHERHAQFHSRFRTGVGGKCNAVFGLMRTGTLKRTPLIGSYPASDTILLGRLALLGEFYEVPEYFFFRRDHPRRSMRANPTFDAAAVWFDPAKKGQIQLPRWKWFFEYLRSIKCVRMSWREKLLCYATMGMWFQWHWKEMKFDLMEAVKRILRRYPSVVWLVRRVKRARP